jgi:hypothetical protein
MKSLVAVLLSLNLFLVALLPGADAHGLVDAATLWEHHDADHAATGFWDFYFDHYVGDHHDSPEHQSLPGHHAHPHTATAVCFFPAPMLGHSPVALSLPAAVRHMPAPRPALQGMAEPCWQPPRA